MELSNAAATTVTITLASDPGDGTTVTLEVDGLGIDTSATTSGGSVSYSIPAVSAANNSIWDATIQVGSNRPATAEVLVVETNTTQAIGVTIDDSSVTYCAPSAGGGGSGTVTSVGLSVPGGFTVAGTNPITTSGTFEITSSLSGIIKGDGAATFSGSASLDDLDDVVLASASFPTPQDGHALRYDATAGKWKTEPIVQSTILTDQTIGDNNTDVFIVGVGGTDYPAQGQVLNWIQTDPNDIGAGGTWSNINLTINADQITDGTIDTARISLAIDDLTDCTVDKTADNIVYTTGTAVRSRAASNWSLSDFTNDLVINDLADVNIAMGAGNQDDVLYYDHAAGAGSKIKGSPIADLLPAVTDSYLMLIESPSDKTYTLDARVAADRTVTAFYAKTASGTCTATLKNLTDATTIGTISVTSTGGSAASLTNTGLTATDRIAIEISSSSSPADLEMVVEYTQ